MSYDYGKQEVRETEVVINKPYVDDVGIYAPVHEYTIKGHPATYKLVMTKEMFVEAYDKYIAHGERKDDAAD